MKKASTNVLYTYVCEYASFEYKTFLGYLLAEA
jgi:hypothetical protein